GPGLGRASRWTGSAESARECAPATRVGARALVGEPVPERPAEQRLEMADVVGEVRDEAAPLLRCELGSLRGIRAGRAGEVRAESGRRATGEAPSGETAAGGAFGSRREDRHLYRGD